MQKHSALLVACGLAACTMGMEADATEQLSTILVDPDSAELSYVSRSGTSLCGFVNAKNRMGGYVGDQVFIIRQGEAPLILPIGGRALEATTEACLDTELSRELLDRASAQNEANYREIEQMVDDILK